MVPRNNSLHRVTHIFGFALQMFGLDFRSTVSRCVLPLALFLILAGPCPAQSMSVVESGPKGDALVLLQSTDELCSAYNAAGGGFVCNRTSPTNAISTRGDLASCVTFDGSVAYGFVFLAPAGSEALGFFFRDQQCLDRSPNIDVLFDGAWYNQGAVAPGNFGIIVDTPGSNVVPSAINVCAGYGGPGVCGGGGGGGGGGTPTVDVQPLNVTLGSTSVVAGGSLAVSWQIRNNGTGTAGTSNSQVRISTSNSTGGSGGPGANVGSPLATGSIAAGASISQNTMVTVPSTPGTYYVWVVADINGALTETSTSNNSAVSASVTVTSTGGGGGAGNSNVNPLSSQDIDLYMTDAAIQLSFFSGDGVVVSFSGKKRIQVSCPPGMTGMNIRLEFWATQTPFAAESRPIFSYLVGASTLGMYSCGSTIKGSLTLPRIGTPPSGKYYYALIALDATTGKVYDWLNYHSNGLPTSWPSGLSPFLSWSSAGVARAVEYFHVGYGHFFVTADPDEIDGLDTGGVSGWARTRYSFKVATSPPSYATSPYYPVCRFWSGVRFVPKSSHFYTHVPTECQNLRTTSPDWQYEGTTGFWLPAIVAPLDPLRSPCGPLERRLVRLYNNGKTQAPNHRYLADTFRAGQSAVATSMVHDQGFTPEGIGTWPLQTFSCVPL